MKRDKLSFNRKHTFILSKKGGIYHNIALSKRKQSIMRFGINHSTVDWISGHVVETADWSIIFLVGKTPSYKSYVI